MGKLIKLIIITISLSILTSQICFAKQTTEIKEVLNNESINLATDKNEIFNVVNSSFDTKIKNTVKNSTNTEAKSFNTDAILKAYEFDNIDILQEYNKEKSLDNVPFNKVVWLEPIFGDNGKVISVVTIAKGMTLDEFNKISIKFSSDEEKKQLTDKVKKHENKWKIERIAANIPDEEFKFFSDNDKIEKILLDNGITKPSKIKLLLTTQYYTDILYIKSGDKEYGIPYSMRPDFNGLENFKLYAMTDLMETMNKHFKTAPAQSGNSDSLGGNGISNDVNPNHKAVAICLGIAIVLFIVLYNRKKDIIKLIK